jgi:Trk K+ transport system NAD-binding subunit
LARCLIIGCGCRGRSLAGELIARGHAVRGTTRDAKRRPAIEESGAEAFVGDPDRIATLTPALDQVTVACVLLGSAVGSPASLAALHGTRLEMLLTKTVDTTVRAIVYEAAGTVDPALLAAGAALVRARCEDSRIPYRLLEADPCDHRAWTLAAAAAVDSALAGGAAGSR